MSLGVWVTYNYCPDRGKLSQSKFCITECIIVCHWSMYTFHFLVKTVRRTFQLMVPCRGYIIGGHVIFCSRAQQYSLQLDPILPLKLSKDYSLHLQIAYKLASLDAPSFLLSLPPPSLRPSLLSPPPPPPPITPRQIIPPFPPHP